MYIVYVLKSTIDGRLYKGLTQDIEIRLAEHNAGKTRSTKGRRPWILVYHESFATLSEARSREKYLKSGYGREYLKKILSLQP